MTVGADRGRAGVGLTDLKTVALGPRADGPNCRAPMDAHINPVCAPPLLQRVWPADPADVLLLTLIHVPGYRSDWHRWFRSGGLRGARVAGGPSLDGSLATLEAALSGAGIMPFIDPYLAAGQLVAPFGDSHALTERCYPRWRDGTRRRDTAAVAESLVELAAG